MGGAWPRAPGGPGGRGAMAPLTPGLTPRGGLAAGMPGAGGIIPGGAGGGGPAKPAGCPVAAPFWLYVPSSNSYNTKQHYQSTIIIT